MSEWMVLLLWFGAGALTLLASAGVCFLLAGAVRLREENGRIRVEPTTEEDGHGR